MRKRRRNAFKRTGKGTRPSANHRRMVKQLAAQGLSGDYIAAKLGVDKNVLRARHALDLHAGRQVKAAERAEAQAKALTKQQLKDRAVIRQTWDYWFDPELNSHLILEGARTPEEAIEMWENSLRTKHNVE